MTKNEIWIDVPDYEGLYQVSSLGRIRRGTRIKKPYIDHGGYLTIWLSKHSKMKCLKVHRIVALAFIPNPENKKRSIILMETSKTTALIILNGQHTAKILFMQIKQGFG